MCMFMCECVCVCVCCVCACVCVWDRDSYWSIRLKFLSFFFVLFSNKTIEKVWFDGKSILIMSSCFCNQNQNLIIKITTSCYEKQRGGGGLAVFYKLIITLALALVCWLGCEWRFTFVIIFLSLYFYFWWTISFFLKSN